ncbi:MAG: transporter associated domain-containing protein [Rickettsiaceae bacterium]|nr:transporter associated domain-containing protein [Rickettsiaceae bacterium]
MANKLDNIADLSLKSFAHVVLSIIDFFRNIFDVRPKNNPPKQMQVLANKNGKINTQSKDSSTVENEIYKNFIKFGSKIVADVMIPRHDICGISSNATESEVSLIVSENCHTRTLVYQDSMDHIIGFVHIKDLYRSSTKNKEFNLKKLTRKHITVAPAMKLIDLLAEMQRRKTHIAVVLDEYGGTDGIATIEDVLKTLVGKIDDEHDAEDETIDNIRLLSPTSILCNARVEIEQVETALSIKLKKADDYFSTIGGLVLARAGYFPKAGTKIMIEDNIFAEIIDANSRSIKRLKLVIG